MWIITCQEANLVSRHRGALPMILSCPHGGAEQPAGAPERTGSVPGCPPITRSRDLNTSEITTRVVQRLLDIFGGAPYVVVAEGGVDAIQLEIASTIRNDNDLRAEFIENLAYAIGAFAARYVTQSAPMGNRSFIPNPCGVQAG